MTTLVGIVPCVVVLCCVYSVDALQSRSTGPGPHTASEGGPGLWLPKTAPLVDSQPHHVIVDDHFTAGSPVLTKAREVFAQRHAPEHARSATSDNFRWEYWNANQGQYSHLRSPGSSFFSGEQVPDGLFAELCDIITSFGQQQLGMNAITPPWISCYIDGCEQRLHTDSPHGPWAYVLSLTASEALDIMDGGNTLIMKPQVLDYWRGFEGYGLEMGDLFSSIRPHFGRILVFDSRLPHGVEQVRGPRAMGHGRLVLHGWFSDPSPFIAGGLASSEDPGQLQDGASEALDSAVGAALSGLEGVGRVLGCLSVRLKVDGELGEVGTVEALCDTLVPDPEDYQGIIGETEDGQPIYEDSRADVLLAIQSALSVASFPPSKNGKDSEITIPFIFE